MRKPTFNPWIVFAAVVLLPVGCTTVRFSEESKQSVREVSIDPDIAEEGTYNGTLTAIEPATRGEAWFGHWITAPVGMVLEIVDWSANRERKSQAFLSSMKDANIDVVDIVRGEFEKKLAAAKVFDSVVSEGGDARIRLSIDHGIDDGMGGRGSWKPWLTVRGELVAKDGRTLWRTEAQVSSYDSRTPEVIYPLRRPERLKRAYVQAARIATAELVRHLRGSV